MDSYLSEIVPALSSIRTTRCGVIAVYCLSIYEWLDTFSTEVKLIYPSRWSSIKAAYYLCRYYPLLLWPLVVVAYVQDHTTYTCSKLTPLVCAFLFPMQLFAPGVMLMRAYAFTGRNFKILVMLLVFYAGLAGVSVVFYCTHVTPLPDITYEILGGTGCFPDYTVPNGETRLLLAMVASVVMDLLSLTIIAIYCLRTRSTRGSLGRIFISQGLVAFIGVLAVHAFALGTYLRSENFHNGVGLPYVLVIPNLLACRLILDLRQKALPTETQILRRHSNIVAEAFVATDVWLIRN